MVMMSGVGVVGGGDQMVVMSGGGGGNVGREGVREEEKARGFNGKWGRGGGGGDGSRREKTGAMWWRKKGEEEGLVAEGVRGRRWVN